MSRDIAPFGVRMPAELKECLTKQANENKRSLNAEIVARLEVTVQQDELHTGGFSHFIDEFLDLMAENASLKAQNNELKAGFPPPPIIQRTATKDDLDRLYENLRAVIERKNNP